MFLGEIPFGENLKTGFSLSVNNLSLIQLTRQRFNHGGGAWMSGCGLRLAQPHTQIPHMRGATPMFDSSGFSSESWAENGGAALEHPPVRLE